METRPERSREWVAGSAGGILLVTGLLGTCPIYKLLGISTCPIQPNANR